MDQEILKLRKINQNDFQTWKEGFWKDIDADEGDFKNLVKEMNQQEQEDRGYSFYAELKSDPVGVVQVFDVLRHPSHSGKIEISIFEKHQKKGLGKKAICLLENFCFEELKLKKLAAYIFPDNNASIALFSSLKYERIYSDPYAFFLKGKPVRCEVYIKLNPLS